jgi:hypothetical protein
MSGVQVILLYERTLQFYLIDYLLASRLAGVVSRTARNGCAVQNVVHPVIV